MSARARIHAMFTLDETAAKELDARLDALVAEVRREDADYIIAIQEQAEADEIAEHGSLDHESELQGQAVRTMAAHLRAEGRRAATATPGFFQPGHTYTRQQHGDTAEFQVRSVDAHPDGGQTAFGFYRRQPRTSWHPYSQDEGEYAVGGWADTADTTQGDHT